MLTARLSQDKLENVFGIIRQYCGTNDHPNPAQFLMTVNCLSFYNLARPPKSGKSPAELIRALLYTSSPATSDAILGIHDIIEDMLEVGNVDGVRSALQSLSDEHSCVIQKSDSRLTYIYTLLAMLLRSSAKKALAVSAFQLLPPSNKEPLSNRTVS